MPIEVGKGAIRLTMGPSQLGGPHAPPDNLEDEVMDFILGARESLDVAVQELESERVTIALCEAAIAGIDVRVILERRYLEGSPRAFKDDDHFVDDRRPHSHNRQMLRALLASGVHVTVDLNPETFHQKYIVRDRHGTSSRAGVLTGSANFTPTGLSSNLNHLVRFRGKKVAAPFADEFNEMWSGTFGKHRTRVPKSPTSALVGGVRVKVLFAPDHAPEMEIMKQVLKARKSVEFAIFTFSQSSGIDDTLSAVARGGVAVRGVFDGRQAAQPWAATHMLTGIDGVDLFNSTRDHGVALLHHKLMVLDREIVIAGSFNYTEPATRLNDENIVVIGERSAIGEAKKAQRAVAAYAAAEIERIVQFNARPFG